MERNEGSLDRAGRLIVGVGLIGAAVAGAIGPWGWIGVVPYLTGAVGWCPLYKVLGIDTCGLRG